MSPRRLEWSTSLMWIGALLVLTSNPFFEEVIILGDMLVVLVTMVQVRLQVLELFLGVRKWWYYVRLLFL